MSSKALQPSSTDDLSALDEEEALGPIASAVAWIDILSGLPSRIHHDNITLPPSLYEQFDLTEKDLRKHLRKDAGSAAPEKEKAAVQTLVNASVIQASTALSAAIDSPAYKSLQANKNTKALAIWMQIKRSQLNLWKKTKPNLLQETVILTPLKKWIIAFKHR